MKTHINEPDASRLASGMRDTGYTFNTAAADIIDNSIAANADFVNVSIDLVDTGDGLSCFVFFGDNGEGMDYHGIINGMRYGAARRKDSKSLGKFGLGLKTASTSVCKKLSVISKNAPEAPLCKFSWDIDHIDEVGKWEMLEEDVEDFEHEKFDAICGEVGTLVVWSKCDRVLKNSQYEPGCNEERAALKRVSTSLKTHVEKHFHKFLDTDDKNFKNITITIDNAPCEPWNPFFPNISEQVLSPNKQILRVRIDKEGNTHDATIKAWILPSRKEVEAAHGTEFAKKVRINNPNQGFYVYREGRMIHAGDWLGIWKSRDAHYSRIRVELDFTHELDEAFEIDVRKAKIIFDENIAAHLEKLLSGPRDEAKKRGSKSLKNAAKGGVSHQVSNSKIKNSPNKNQPKVEEVDPTSNSVTLTGSMGMQTFKMPVFQNISPDEVFVTPKDDINSGDMWEVGFNSESDCDYQVAAHINRNHDFYTKVYSKCSSDVVDGLDFLLWSLASAEASHTTQEMKAFWDDVRSVVSRNLRTLLSDYEIPNKD